MVDESPPPLRSGTAYVGPARTGSLTPLRRFGWASAVLVALVLLVAVAQYLTAPRDFMAQRDLRVIVIPGDQSQGADAAVWAARAAAGEMTDPAFVGSSALAADILANIPAEEAARLNATPQSVQRALSAAHDDTTVTLRARWATAAGADEILAATLVALPRDPVLLQSLVGVGDTVRVQVEGTATPATLAADREEEARQTLLGRALLGLLAALLLPYALALLLPGPRITPPLAPLALPDTPRTTEH